MYAAVTGFRFFSNRVVEVDRKSRKVKVKSDKEQTGEKEYFFDAVHGNE